MRASERACVHACVCACVHNDTKVVLADSSIETLIRSCYIGLLQTFIIHYSEDWTMLYSTLTYLYAGARVLLANSIHIFIHMSIRMSMYMPIRLSIHMSIHRGWGSVCA